MIPAAKELTLSMNSDVCAVLPLAADPQLAENSPPGFATLETSLHPGFAVSNSTTALGMHASLALEGIRKYESARYYEPSSSRFLSEDPIGFLGGLNFYSYVLNSPTSLSDSTGLQAGVKAGAAIAQLLSNYFVPLPSGGFAFYGNWGGPGWTGGQSKPYEDLTPEEQAHLAPPIDDQDACYMEHDICYSKSRVRNHCTAKDKPNEMQARSDTIESASCDAYLAQCLSKVHSSESHITIAIPVFKIKAYGKAVLFTDSDSRPSWLMDISDKIGGKK